MKVQQYQKFEYPKKSNPSAKTLYALSQVIGYEIEFKKMKKKEA
jgi:transcriptional regulator with XRE-family HTH domain